MLSVICLDFYVCVAWQTSSTGSDIQICDIIVWFYYNDIRQIGDEHLPCMQFSSFVIWVVTVQETIEWWCKWYEKKRKRIKEKKS